jgi:hypothetical protein
MVLFAGCLCKWLCTGCIKEVACRLHRVQQGAATGSFVVMSQQVCTGCDRVLLSDRVHKPAECRQIELLMFALFVTACFSALDAQCSAFDAQTTEFYFLEGLSIY